MDNKINTFELSSKWFAYVAENKNIKNNHTSLYFYILNKCNLLFWKKHFGLPTDSTMESLNISSYKTYIKTLTELSDTGFIKIIERSKNQHTSNIIEVVKNTKATTKANTNSLLKQEHTQCQSNDQVNVSIIKLLKQVNNKTIKTDKQIKVLLELKESIIENYTNTELKVYSNEILDCYNQVVDLFDRLKPKTDKQVNEWKEEIRKLLEIDKYDIYTIIHVCQKARADSFWSSNFLTIKKLRNKNKEGLKYIEVFIEKFKQNEHEQITEELLNYENKNNYRF